MQVVSKMTPGCRGGIILPDCLLKQMELWQKITYRKMWFKPIYCAAFTSETGIMRLSGDSWKGRVESKAVQLPPKA